MDVSQIPGTLPTTVVRPRPLVVAVMAESLNEQGPASRTATAWRWVLTGQGPSPVSGTPGSGRPPVADEITAEARHGADATPPQCGWPPWRYRRDFDPDRQQARRVLRWLTGAADAIPLVDPGRGRHAGARFHFARTDEEIRRVRGWALHGLAQHGDLPAEIPIWHAERPWGWPASWMNAAWLRGAVAYLDWVLGETPVTPLSHRHVPLQSPAALASAEPGQSPQDLVALYGVGCGIADIEEELTVYLGSVIAQGHEGQPPADPGRYPPPQWGEGVQQAHDWVTGEESKPPADHHGCGAYYPCPGDRRCLCEAAGQCLRGGCPACTDRICNVGWAAIGARF